MARGQTRSLVLEISGDVSKLNTAQKAARSALLGMKGDVESLEQAFDRAWSDLGGDAATQARAAEREFNRMFNSIKRNAQSMVAEGNGGKAMQLFDVGAADEQVRALTSQSGLLRQQASALELASKEGGEFSARQREMAVALLGSAKEMEAQARAIDHNASALRGISAPMAEVEQAAGTATRSNSAFAAGMQQAGFQASDFVVQVSGGTSAIRAFSMQGPQMVQALAVMGMGAENTNGKFAKFTAFLAGPWGAAITVGVSVVGLLASGLLEAGDASDELTDQLDFQAMSTDELTAAINEQLNAQRQSIQLSYDQAAAARNVAAENLRAAISEREKTKAMVDGYNDLLESGQAGEAAPALSLARGRYAETLASQEANVSGLEELLRIAEVPLTRRRVEAANDPASASQLRFEALESLLTNSYAAGSVSEEDFNRQLGDLYAQRDAEQERIRETGRDRPERKPREKKDEAERLERERLQRERAYEDRMAQANSTVLDQLLARAQTEDVRLALQLQMLQGDRDANALSRARAVADGEMLQEQADALAEIEARADGLREENLRAEAREAMLDRLLEQDSEEIAAQISLLRLQGQFAVTLDQRRRVAQQLLDLELEERRLAAQRLLDSENPNDQRAGRDAMLQIAAEEPYRRREIEEDHADPVERYVTRLTATIADMDTAFDQVRADGLQSLEDGLVGIITGTESVAGAFKKMASQIIADLVRIQVQKMILGAISGGAFSFLGLAEGGEVGEFASGGFVSGPGGPTSDSIPAMLSNGEFVINAAATARFLPLLHAINDGKVPGFATGGMVTPRMPRLPAMSQLRAAGGAPMSVQQHFHIDAKGAVLATELVAEMQRIGASATIGGAQMAQVEMAESQADALY